MSIRFPLIVSIALIAAMLAASLYVWTVLPEHAQVPVHWDIDGKVNGFAGKSFALFYAPAILSAICALLAFIPRIEPRRLNLANSAKFYRATWIGIVCVLAAIHAATLSAALRLPVNVALIATVGIALVFMLIGNYLGKTRSNFFAGIRTPWTLSSEYSWERTHRLTGRLFVLTGAVGLAALLAFGVRTASLILFAALGASAVVGVVMSYVYWRRDPERRTGAQK